MTESVLTALIGVGGVFVGAIIGAISNHLTSRSGKLIKRRTDALIRAYQDISALHRLEARYIEHLASAEQNAEAWKRRVRKEQSEAGESMPSEDATDRKARKRIAELSP